MPQKYLRRSGLPLLVRYSGRTTLPQDPPAKAKSHPVLCLHDAGLQSSVFEDLRAALGPDSGAVAFDLPGHGRSGSLDSLPSIEDMTELACWVADACHLERPILVGHGMGALLALEWAKTRGDTIEGIVLCGVGAALGITDEAIETMRKVTRGKAPRPFDPTRLAKDADPELVKRAYMEGIQTDPRATLVDLEASRRWADAFEADLAESAHEIDRPARVVCGTAEHADCRERAEQLAHVLGAHFTPIPHAAHLLPLEQPEALAAEIRTLAGEA
jgi:pimeloyl-ACP methyl ester carboxylesterase